MKRILNVCICLFLVVLTGYGQSPHGDDFVMDCAKCHTSDDWSFNMEASSFRHDSTSFALRGRHEQLDCRSCHQSLEFKKAESTCISCHDDLHQQTVGFDCARCHNTRTWVVENITQMHEQVSFPLLGAHLSIDCNECHKSETNLRFDPISPECISCHKNDYEGAKIPDHVAHGFPVDCSLCHSQTQTGWSGETILHSFFPLVGGHQISDCSICHTTSVYADISPDCIICHVDDFNNAKNPDHTLFPQQCNLCHGLNPGWMPASYSGHDSIFPIYSGNHKGEWNNCMDCHTISGDFTSFSCIDCHEHNNPGSLAKEHDEVAGYQYVSTACFGCHPKGD